jgi:hypothetical protein
MMTASRKPSKSRKPQPRHINISRPVNGNFAIALFIGEGAKAKRYCYYLEPIPADFGLGFRLEKFSNEVEEGEPSEYHVNIDPQHGHHTCECMGHQRWHHCKHVEALVSLLASGKIPTNKPQATSTTPVMTNAEEPMARVLLGGESHRQEMAARVVNPVCFMCDQPYESCRCSI